MPIGPSGRTCADFGESAATVDGRLVGRTAELKLIDDALSTLDKKGLSIVVVSGAHGTGKTRLLDELAGRALAAGLHLRRAQAFEMAQSVELSVLTDALDPLIECPPGPSPHRFRVQRSIKHRLESVRGGSALLLDDVHWADPASLEQIEHLVRQPPRAPLLLALAFRSGRPPAAVINAAAHHDSAVTWVQPGPLTAADLRLLLPDAAEDRRNQILQATEGNPLYVRTLAGFTDATLTALATAGRPVLDEGPERDILAGLAAEILMLDGPEQHVAFATAVLGEGATVDAVSSVAGLSIPTVLDVIGQLRRLGLLVFDGELPRFWHPLLRVAADELADVGWPPATRARATVLPTSPAPPPAPAPVDPSLTAREVDIATLVADGLSNREIAARLFLSHRTVEAHLSRMYNKLDIRSRTELIRSLVIRSSEIRPRT